MLPGRKYKAEDILRILWRRKWLILLPFAICSSTAYVIAKRIPDLYRSETTILVVPQRVPESYVRSTVSGRIEDRVQSLQQQILSRSRLERIILDFNLYDAARRSQPMESVVQTMRAAVKVETVKGGEAFTVEYTAADPRTVQAVTERLASLFIEENVHDRELLAIGTSNFLQTQLDDARQRLIEQEKRLEKYRIEFAGQLPSQAPANLQAIQSLRLQLQALDDTQTRSRDRQLALERQLSELLVPDAAPRPAVAVPPPAAPDDSAEITGATPREQLDSARRRLASLEARLTPAHPDVTRLKRTVAQLEARAAADPQPAPAVSMAESLRDRRARDLRADLDGLTKEIANKAIDQRRVRDEMALYQSRLDAAPIREAELTELTRDYDTMQQIYRTLLAKREDSKVAANLEHRQVGEQFRVLDPARVPEQPFSPNRPRLNLIGAALGLLIGLGATALLEYLDNTLKSEEDVRLLLGLPVVATIPVLGAQQAAR